MRGTNTRQAWLQVYYENVDITTFLSTHLLSWTFTDNLSGQADDLQLTLEDMDWLWVGDWAPNTGATLSARIVRENWDVGNERDTIDLGLFEIDELSVAYPPSTTSIKAISVPESSSLRGQQKNRSWEKTRLSTVARDIANAAGLKLMFDVGEDPVQDRFEQAGETDLSFLLKSCTSAGLCLKVTGSEIVIFDERKYESQAPIMTIRRGVTLIKSFTGRKSTTGLYKACRVEYQSPSSQPISYTFTPSKPPKTGRTLYINEQVDSTAQAQKIAQNKLREANREAETVDITTMGDIHFVAGVTIMLIGFGTYDGKYIVTQATHSSGSGYETSLQLRRCLEGY